MTTRWGCVGAGKIAWDFFLAMQMNLPVDDHELVAVAARDLGRAQAFADKFRFKRAYDSYEQIAQDKDVDVVYISTIHTTHVELSKMMLNAGKHVVCEKPMSLHLNNVKDVIELAREKKLFFVEAIWTRFNPAYRKIRSDITSGALGDVMMMQATFCVPLDNVERIRKLETGGGGLLDIGIYTIQAACAVFGEKPESVTAVATLTPLGVDESVSITLKYKSGAMATLFHSIAVRANNWLQVVGTKGAITVRTPFWSPTEITTPSGSMQIPLKQGDFNFMNSSALFHEAAAVREALLKEKTECEEMTWGDSIMVHEIIEEVRRQIGLVYPDTSC